MSIVSPYRPVATPIIDRAQSLANGLVFDWIPTTSGILTPKNNVYNDFGTATNTPTQSVRLYGQGVDFGTNADYFFTDRSYLSNFNHNSFESIFIQDSAGGSGYGRLFAHTDTSTGWHWLEVYNDNGTGGWGLGFGCSYNGDPLRIFSIPYPSWGVVHHIVMTWDHSSTNNAPTIWLDGVQQTVTDRYNNNFGIVNSSNDIEFTNATTNVWDGTYFLTRYWKRLLTKNEVSSLFVNPFRIYKNPKVAKLNSVAAAAATYNATRMMMGMGI